MPSTDFDSIYRNGLVSTIIHTRPLVQPRLYRRYHSLYVTILVILCMTNYCMRDTDVITFAASGLYALGFGLLGLIPAPKVQRR